MKPQLKVVRFVLMLASFNFAGFIDAIRDFDNDHSTIPAKLSEIGMYSDIANKVLAEDLVYYEVNTPYWVDGTHKKRWIWLPPGTQIVPNDSIGWEYPEGTVIAKNFYLDTIIGDPASEILIETRLNIKRAARWRYITFEWRLDQTDANLVAKSGIRDVFFRRWANGNQVLFRWKYPNTGMCTNCHDPFGAIGINGPNMNLTSPLDGTKNQLQDLADRGVFSVNLLAANPTLHKWVDLDDPEASLEVKSRSWFAMNCGYCHRDDNSPGGAHSFTYWKKDKEANYLDLPAYAFAEFPKLIVPGAPDSSYFLKRMTSRKTFNTYNGTQMPPELTYIVDSAAVKVISDWICELGNKPAGCNPIAYSEPLTVEEDEFINDPEGYLPNIKSLPVNPHSKIDPISIPTAFVRNQVLFVNGVNVKESQIILTDLKGNSLKLRKLGASRYYVEDALPPGIYIIKAGAKSLKIQNLGKP